MIPSLSTEEYCANPTGPFDVLVVDDSRTNLEVIGRRLMHRGHRTCLCASGIEALDRIQGRSFDIVILDMVMPGMSGVAVLREIRQMSHTQNLPVLMMTARSDPAAVVEALGAGADDHVAKPFEFEALIARMERLIARAREHRALLHSNARLDARIAERAIEIGELRAQLQEIQLDRQRLVQKLRALHLPETSG